MFFPLGIRKYFHLENLLCLTFRVYISRLSKSRSRNVKKYKKLIFSGNIKKILRGNFCHFTLGVEK